MNASTVAELHPNLPKTVRAFVRGNKMYFVPQNIKNFQVDDMISLITHEIGHIKDPAMTRSPKLRTSYNVGLEKAAEANKAMANLVKGTPEYDVQVRKFAKNYKLHPYELVANNAMALNNLTTQTVRMMKTEPKGVVLQGLQEIIDFFTKKKTNLSNIGKKMLMGPKVQESMLSLHYDTLAKYNKRKYYELAEKMAKQAEYLKSQVKMAK